VSLAACALFAFGALPALTYFTGVEGLVKYWCGFASRVEGAGGVGCLKSAAAAISSSSSQQH